MAQLALRWILMFDAVSCTIPGAKRPAQVEDTTSPRRILPELSEKDRACGGRQRDAYIRTSWCITGGKEQRLAISR